ncbi:hypothetical protein CR513_44877, partial [Mucuna pruriens]
MNNWWVSHVKAWTPTNTLTSSQPSATYKHIDLFITFSDPSTLRTISVYYLIVAANTSYNVLIDQSTLNALSAIVSTPYLVMKFPSLNGQCHIDSLKVSAKLSKEDNISTYIKLAIIVEADYRPPIDQGAEPIEKLEYIPMIDEEHRTHIGERMQGPHRERLVSTLWDHADLFSWQPSDMLGIDPNVIFHRLALCVEAKLVVQRKRKTGGDKRKAI